jgi:choline dehydrogenase-like flavoprotein
MIDSELLLRTIHRVVPNLGDDDARTVLGNLRLVLGEDLVSATQELSENKSGKAEIHSALSNAIFIAYWATEHGASAVGFSGPVLSARTPPATPSKSPANSPRNTARSSFDSSRHFDAIVIGAGAGGAVMAQRLADAGRTVLILERGEAMSLHDIGRDHLRNQRVAIGGHNAGPFDGNPRVVVNERGIESVVEPWDVRYHANAAMVGGGTAVYGGQAWRFNPTDFAMASTYGVPGGSSLADWPISYADVSSHYDRIEHELGVCGHAASMTHLPRYEREYPMPPMRSVARTRHLQTAADSLGWATLPPPLAINSIQRDGRAACIECAQCVGFACSVDAKNGTQNTFILRAIATGRVQLLTNAMVSRITISQGRARAVEFTHNEKARTITADLIVCSAGAIETARLLLLSGVEHEMLGRNLQGHVYIHALGLMDERIFDGVGPGPTIATNRWMHHNDGIVGGGMILDDFVMLPVAFWGASSNVPRPTIGQEAIDWMRTYYSQTIDLKGPIQDIPSPTARVQLDKAVRDRYGIPVARLSGATHPESIRAAQFLNDRAIEWLRACGAKEIWSNTARTPHLSGGQHQAGTCRMGHDPATSVVDPRGRVHGVPNLIVADSSVHVTNGGVNPFLTVMALADRAATLVLADSI